MVQKVKFGENSDLDHRKDIFGCLFCVMLRNRKRLEVFVFGALKRITVGDLKNCKGKTIFLLEKKDTFD